MPKNCVTFLQRTSPGQQHHLFPLGRSQCSWSGVSSLICLFLVRWLFPETRKEADFVLWKVSGNCALSEPVVNSLRSSPGKELVTAMTALLNVTTDVKTQSGWMTGRRSSWPGSLKAQPLEQLRMSQPLNVTVGSTCWSSNQRQHCGCGSWRW